jgi:hypothetical protein
MEEENNHVEADTPENGNTGEAETNVSSASIRDVVNEATGRDYKSDEEAIKGIKETTSYVGKVGKYKDVISAIEAAQGGEQKAIDYLSSIADGKDETEKVESITAKQQKEIDELKEANFLSANSDLAPHMELIKNLRKDGETFEQVLERNKETFDALRASTQNQTKSVIHSNNRTVTEESDYKKDFEKAQKTGNWAEFLQKHKGVK